jgi:hypothetical protein
MEVGQGPGWGRSAKRKKKESSLKMPMELLNIFSKKPSTSAQMVKAPDSNIDRSTENPN